MITGATLKAAVLARLELNNDATTITRFLIYENINAAVRFILWTFPLPMIDNAIKTVKGNLVAATSAYQWPSDYVRMIKLWVDFTNQITQTNPGYEAVLSLDNALFVNSLDQRPDPHHPRFDIVEGGFDVRPVPAGSLSNGFRLRYVYLLPTVSDSQQCLLRADLENAVVLRAVAFSAMIDGYRPDLADKFDKMFWQEAQAFGVKMMEKS